MQTTFENTEKQHLRRKELERHLEVIASAGATSELQLYSDNPDLAGLADDLTGGQPLTKSPPVSDGSVAGRRRPKGRLAVWVILILVTLGVLLSVLSSSLSGPSPSVSKVDEETARFRHLFSLVLDFKITTRSELELENSPQAQALNWLAFQDTADDVEDLRTRYSLATLYFSTHANGTRWKNNDHWLSTNPVCLWYGIECMKTQANVHLVKAVNLLANGLDGTIPEELSLLQHDCQVLDLSYNNIRGRIPITMGKHMQNLQRLYLGPNSLSSTIPESLYELRRLTHLYIDSCDLHGTLSKSINKMENLHGLGLHDNRLTGTLPTSIGALTGLRVLNLDGNHLEGTIPFTLGSLTGLVDLRLDQNSFTGHIPTQLARLNLLEILYLDNNELTGHIPDVVAESVPFLNELHLHNNELSGTVPSGFAGAPFLQVAYLDGNDLTGTMPKAICDRRRDGVLEDLWADCAETAEIECDDCCTRCLPETD
eukprot:scaffold36845_cov168-Amphora_coffeaeformis.AAC.2